MANTFLTPSVVAREALMVLENNLVMANLVHRDYSDEFVQVGDTVTIRKPAKFTAKNFAGSHRPAGRLRGERGREDRPAPGRVL